MRVVSSESSTRNFSAEGELPFILPNPRMQISRKIKEYWNKGLDSVPVKILAAMKLGFQILKQILKWPCSFANLAQKWSQGKNLLRGTVEFAS